MKLLNSLKMLQTYVKRKHKEKMFDKFSTHGQNLVVTYDSFCNSVQPNQIYIGDNCEICGRLQANTEGKIKIGNYCTIRFSSKVSSVDSIVIGDYVIISNNVTITDHNSHPTDPSARINMSKSGFHSELWKPELSSHAPVNISSNVWIGEGATILKGVTIGEGAIVASHSVVTKNVAPYVIVAGNPATVVKKISVVREKYE